MAGSRIGTFSLISAGLVMVATPVLAQIDVRRLEGERTSDAERTLRDLGYREARRGTEGGNNWTYFRNDSANNPCVGIASRNGRVSAATGFAASECHGNGGGDAGAVAGVAIAALIGAALLSHHGNNHRDGNHYTDQNQEAEFERGYRDGLHDGQFVNYDHNQQYVDGYAAGQRERENQLTANRHHYTESRRNNGHRADLAAACAREADSYWGMRPGTSSAYDVRSTGNDMFDVTVAAGYNTGTCSVSRSGQVRFIQNN